MAEVRNFKLPAVWAQNALTTIPTPPVVNLAYRNANLSADDIEQGQLYGALGNSADWNQMLWLLSAIANEGQNQGILSWSPLIDYAIGAWVMGTNGNAYTALKASGPATAIVDPATEEESEDMTWLDVTAKLQGGEQIQPFDGTPSAPGTASPGFSDLYARGDHVHPVDSMSGVPVGSVIYFGKSTVPSGYLVCNGGSYSSTTYSALYAVIGTTFGGTTSSFKVPNLIDNVAWGNATVGTSKSAGLPNITGSMSSYASQDDIMHVFDSATGAFSLKSGTATYYILRQNLSATTRNVGISFSAQSSNPIYGASPTVQPPALTLLPCIKY